MIDPTPTGKRTYASCLYAACCILCLHEFSHAQGPLAPPAAPGPTMKTLEQVEPRTPISQADFPYVITAPGSYYLTENITATSGSHGIRVDADDVTLDLNGFVLDGNGMTGDTGVFIVGGRRNVIVLNGTVREWADVGIGVGFGGAPNTVVYRVRAYENLAGIATREESIIEECTAVRNLEGGISAGDRSKVLRCRALSDTDFGILARRGSLVEDCIAVSNNVGGIIGHGDCAMRRNLCSANGLYNILAQGNGNRIQNNEIVDGPGDGLRLTDTNNYVTGNIVRGNADNYDIVAGNQLNLLLSEIPESIDWPARVKLAGTLTGTSGANGITVNASDVTIDLDGHALVGVPGSLDGIVSGVSSNIVVHNGTVRAWDGDGIDATLAFSGRYRNLRLAGNGANGLLSGFNSTVADSTAWTNGIDGIVTDIGSVVLGCTANNNVDDGILLGIGGAAGSCTAQFNGDNGFAANPGSTLNQCTASANRGHGIQAGSDCTINGCTAWGNVADGIWVSPDCHIRDNTCNNNGAGFGGDGAGIHATSSDNRIDGNNVTGNDRGIDVEATGNLIVRNSASGNSTNYNIVAGNSVGTIVVSPAGAGAWDNFAF